jgi:hypothetical protein
MAKSLNTRQKLVFRCDGLRPRNPLVIATRQRAAGPHQATPGGLRQQAKRRLKRMLGDGS